MGTARVVGCQRAHHVVGDLGVEQQAEHVVVAQCQVGTLHPVDRTVGDGDRVAHRSWLERRSDRRVAGGFEIEGQRPGTDVCERHAGAPRVHALQRFAVQPHQALGLEAGAVVVEAEVDDRLELRPHPVGRYVDGAPEPGGAPGAAPRAAHRERLVLLGDGLVVGDRFAGCVPGLDRERHGAVVQVWQHPLPHLSLDPFLDDHPVVVHPRILGNPGAAGAGRGGPRWWRGVRGGCGGGCRGRTPSPSRG